MTLPTRAAQGIKDVTFAGTMNGAPTGGVLDLSHLTLTLPDGMGGGGGDFQPLDATLTALSGQPSAVFGIARLADPDAATARTALGLGTLATQNGTFSGTSSGTNTGDQDLSGYMLKANNLSDLISASAARTNLGLGTLATQSGTFSGTSSGTNTGDQTSVTGNAGTATALQTARAINGVNFDGTAAITVPAAAGTLTGSTLASGVTASSLTGLGTVTSGTWSATVVAGQYGGTGVANTGKTITLAGNLTTTGSFNTTLAQGGNYTLTTFGNTTIPVASQNLTLNGPTAARTVTLPDANITVARTDAAQTFTGLQTAAGFAVNSSAVNAQTGTSYTLQSSDNGKIVTLSNAGAITLTVPSGLAVGFSCVLIQLGAGQVTLSPSSTTINSVNSATKLYGQYASATLISYATNVFSLTGDTTN